MQKLLLQTAINSQLIQKPSTEQKENIEPQKKFKIRATSTQKPQPDSQQLKDLRIQLKVQTDRAELAEKIAIEHKTSIMALQEHVCQ
jgi:hypothetical protein